MKQLFTLLIFCLLGAQAKAQWVELPNYTFYFNSFPLFNSTCVYYDSTASLFKLDTFCSKEQTSVNLNLKKNDKNYDNSELLQFLKYFTNVETLTLYINLDEDKEETILLNFSEIKTNLKDLRVEAKYSKKYDGSHLRKQLVVNSIPNSVVELRLNTGSFGEYNIDKWPSVLKNLTLREDFARNDFLLNLNLPTILDDLDLSLELKDISLMPLPSSLKQFSLSSLNFDHSRINNIQNLVFAKIHNRYSDVSKTVTLNIDNSYLKTLSLTGGDDSLNMVSFDSPKLDFNQLPSNIESLGIYAYELDELDVKAIPASVKELELGLDENSSGFINTLPDYIQKLILSYVESNITKFPKNLKSLELNNSNLESLPVFPEGLDSLIMYSLNNLKCLPIFPENLKYFEGDNLGDVECIPNETLYVKADEEWPVCTDAQYICNAEELTTVTGTVYLDKNKNGVKDAGDFPLYGNVLSLNEETFATSNTEGIYKLILREQGTFEVKASSNHPYFISSIPAVKTIVYDENYINDSVHFLMQIEDVKDLKINGTNLVARPGMNTSVTAFVENFGINDLSNVTVKIKKPQDWNFAQARPSGYREDNDTLIWENINLNKLSVSSFNVQTKLPATATILGNSYQYEMWVENKGDITPENNYYSIIDTIIGSYDPNDKVVNYTSLTPENSNSQELIYTIRFQNTGTDTAFKVVVIDTIVGNLDPSSIKVLGASHDFTWEYTGQGIAAFTFDNILLPDSNTNEAASHGFVTLTVKANKDLAVGDSIYNRAGIYFDFNEPVITNKALTRIATVTSIYTYTNTSLKIYPNPAKDNVRVEWNSKDKATLRLLDVSGKVIQTQMLNRNYSDIDVSKLSKGLYLIQLQTKEGVSTGKLLIQ